MDKGLILLTTKSQGSKKKTPYTMDVYKAFWQNPGNILWDVRLNQRYVCVNSLPHNRAFKL